MARSTRIADSRAAEPGFVRCISRSSCSAPHPTSTPFSTQWRTRSAAGSLALVKDGAGNQTFGGTNTFSGGTTINAGLLRVGNGNTNTAGSLIAVGFFASVAAFIASGEMAVAYFKAHASRGFWPILNGGERAVFYCFFFLFVAARGSGPLSLDSLRRRTRGR